MRSLGSPLVLLVLLFVLLLVCSPGGAASAAAAAAMAAPAATPTGGAPALPAPALSAPVPAAATVAAAAAAHPVETVKGFFTELAVGPVGSGPAIVAVDEDDTVWVAVARTGKLARLLNGKVELFDVGTASRPVGLAAGTRRNGSAGVIWIAASYDNKLVRFDVATRTKKEFKIEGDESWPFNLAIAPDGSVWFTQRASGRLGHLDPATGAVRQLDLPTPNGGPAGLGIDPRSGDVWFTESYADRVARLDPATGKIEELAMSDASTGQVSGPAGLAIDDAGGVWFAKLEGKLGHIAPGSRRIELVETPPQALRPAGVAVGPNRDVWAVALDGNLLLRYRPATGAFTQYPLPSGQPDAKPANPPYAKTSRPFGIAVDRTGNVWFSEQYLGQVGVLDVAPPRVEVLSPAGTVVTARVPLTMQVADPIAGIARTSLRLDGVPVKLEHGQLDLGGSLPGSHLLEVSAESGAGTTGSASVRFEYAPNHLALEDLVARLQPLDDAGAAAREQWLALARALPKGDAKVALASLRAGFGASAGHFRADPADLVGAVLAFQERDARQKLEVAIQDKPPYFTPHTIRVQKGTSVLWRYDPPSDGHSLPRATHRLEIQAAGGPVLSGPLRPGETFVYRFESAGRYAVRDVETPDAKVTVEVVAQ